MPDEGGLGFGVDGSLIGLGRIEIFFIVEPLLDG